MSVLGGKYCAVNGLSTTARWSLNETTNVPRFRASNLRGGTGRRRGVYDYSGVIEGYGEMPPVMPSEYFDFAGFTAPTTGVHGTNGKSKEAVNAIVDQITVAWNWNTAEILKWTVNFSCGEPVRISENAAGDITDVSNPTIFEVCGLIVEIGAEEEEEEWTNIQSALLTINAENAQFVNSSTNCIVGRRPGPIDWTLALTEDNNGKFSTFDPGEQGRFRLFTTSLRYWLLEWGHYVDRTNLRVDAETGEIISQQHNWAMNCVDDADDTEIGVIARPGETGGTGGDAYWWPTLVLLSPLPFDL